MSAHGRGDPAPARRAHRGALRRDAHAVVDGRRPEGRGLRHRHLHLHERPAGVAALVPRPHDGGDALQAVPRPGRGLRDLRQGRHRHHDQRPEGARPATASTTCRWCSRTSSSTPTARLFYPTEGISPVHPIWVPEFFGDTPVVNGKAYPYLDAQPRRYRLRLLNGSQARFYNLQLRRRAAATSRSGSSAPSRACCPKPVEKTSLLIAPGERFDVIVDFTGLPLGSTVMMTNDANAPYPDGDAAAHVPELMKININTPVPANDPDTSVPPAKLKLPASASPRRDARRGAAGHRGEGDHGRRCTDPRPGSGDGPERGAAQRLPLHGPDDGLRQGRHDRDLAAGST